MKEKLTVHKTPVLIASAVGLAAIVILAVLLVSKDEEQTDAEPSTVEVMSEAQTTKQPADIADVEEATEEPTLESASEIEPAFTEESQKTAIDMEDYVSVTESFSVVIPTGWSSAESFPGGAIMMANSEAALDRFNNGGAVSKGDIVLNIGFLPFELFRQREVVPLDIQFETTPDVFMKSLLPIFRTTDDAIHGNVELVSLSAERDAGLMTVSDGESEGLVLMFMAGNEVVGVVSAVGSPGEVDSFQETIFLTASGVSFHGDQGALYGALLEG